MDSRMYPQGKGAVAERYINDVLVIFGMARSLRQRVAAAALTTTGGLFTELPALPGVRWRLLDFTMIAIGGNATTSTSINIFGTRAGSVVELAAVAIAALTRSAVVRAGATNAVVLADGASHTQLDANTAVGYKAIGATLTVSTFVDFLISYAADPA